MLRFETFQTYLSKPVSLRPLESSLLSKIQNNLRSWSAQLSMKSESEQCTELEKLLSELIIVQISDSERSAFMQQIFPIVQRLIGQLHQHYIYETSIINANQLQYVHQVKSLYFLSALVFDGVHLRELYKAKNAQTGKSKLFQLRNQTSCSTALMLSLYHLIQIFLNLLMEDSLTYQRPPSLYWQKLNDWYRMALDFDCADKDLQTHVHSGTHPISIENAYRQACLHSLLGLSSYRRQDIVGVQKLLPIWSQQIHITQTPHRQFRTFIDLQDKLPPQRLSKHSKINPFDDGRDCVFIDLRQFEDYLENNHQSTANNNSTSSAQARLAKMAWHTLKSSFERGEERHLTQDNATVVTGFNLIHFYMAGKKPLSVVIQEKAVESTYRPKYDTMPKAGYSQKNLAVQLIDKSTTGCRFKWLHETDLQNHSADSIVMDLQVLSLFAIQRQENANEAGTINLNKPWQIGLVRWVESHDDIAEAGGRIIGFDVTACGVRLETKDNRSQDFVPAMLLAGSDTLGSKTTLLLPRYHFRKGDKVVLRIGTSQTLLRLHQALISSDDFEQFDMLRINA